MWKGNEITSFTFLLVLCIGGIGERSSDKHSIFPQSSSHAIRHSKRHMLAQDVENSDPNASLFLLDGRMQSESLVIPPYSASVNVKSDSNQTMASGMSTEVSPADPCHSDGPCETLSALCIKCKFNTSCIYGEDVNITCEVKDDTRCQGSRNFTRTHSCRYCYQTPQHEHNCQRNTTCHVVSAPRQRFIAKCVVKNHVLCLGNRVFAKHVPCNWTKGYSWGTALLLSIVFGGFGVDRFYLGMWQEGIGKLFSFGGLGVWTLVDVILIATGYLGPADHSLYIRH